MVQSVIVDDAIRVDNALFATCARAGDDQWPIRRRSLPKGQLVSKLQALLHVGELRIAAGLSAAA